MRSFTSVLPQLAFILAAELRASGRADLARELEASDVTEVSFDSETNAGLVALKPPRQLSSVERSVIGQKLGQVIPFSRPNYVSLQLDNFGRVVAVELLAPPLALGSTLLVVSRNWKAG